MNDNHSIKFVCGILGGLALLCSLTARTAQRGGAVTDALVQGAVLCGDAKANAGRAQISAQGYKQGATSAIPISFQSTADETGKFSLPLAAGTYMIRAQTPKCAPARNGKGRTVITVNPQDVKNVNLSLPVFGSIAGRVVGIRGEPVHAFRVEALR